MQFWVLFCIFALQVTGVAQSPPRPAPALTIDKLAAMNPLPSSAKVTGTVTDVAVGFGQDGSYVLTLDKRLPCELVFTSPTGSISGGYGGGKYVAEKQGDKLVVFSVHSQPGPRSGAKGEPVLVIVVGQSATVQGILNRRPNGKVVLKGVLVRSGLATGDGQL